jgi:putative transposase
VGVCRTHYLRNLLSRVPKTAQPHVATQVRTIFDQADTDAVCAQFDRVVDALTGKYPDAAAHLENARDELLAFTGYPHEIWRQIWSNNPVRHEALCDRAEMEGLRLRVVAAA